MNVFPSFMDLQSRVFRQMGNWKGSRDSFISGVKGAMAEFIGTALFIYAHHSAVTAWPSGGASELRNAFTAGFGIATFVHATAHISGGQFNPVVTVALLVFGEISFPLAVCFILAQLSGASAGSFFVWLLTPHDYNPTIASTTVNPDISVWQGLGVEIIITYQLLFMIFATIDNDRKDIIYSKPLAIGLSVVVGILAGINYTGASMNPARSFGSALISNTWTDHWIYWVGPFIGGLAGAVSYRLIVKPLPPKSDTELEKLEDPYSNGKINSDRSPITEL